MADKFHIAVAQNKYDVEVTDDYGTDVTVYHYWDGTVGIYIDNGDDAVGAVFTTDQWDQIKKAIA